MKSGVSALIQLMSLYLKSKSGAPKLYTETKRVVSENKYVKRFIWHFLRLNAEIHDFIVKFELKKQKQTAMQYALLQKSENAYIFLL